MSDEMSEKQQREMARLDWEYHKQESLDRLRIQESLGLTVLKGLTLTNGGALIALFTFLGSSTSAMRFSMPMLWAAFGAFVAGLVLTLVANTCAYFMQVQFAHATNFEMWNAGRRSLGGAPGYDPLKPMAIAGRFEIGMIVTAIMALSAFCLGAGIALAAVTG